MASEQATAGVAEHLRESPSWRLWASGSGSPGAAGNHLSCVRRPGVQRLCAGAGRYGGVCDRGL